MTVFRTPAKRLRAEAQQARLVLIDADMHFPGRLDPVEIHIHGIPVGCDDLSKLEGNFANLRYVGTADPILYGPPDGRPKFQRADACNEIWKLVGQDLLEFCPEPFARLHILGDDDGLGKEVIRQLDV